MEFGLSSDLADRDRLSSSNLLFKDITSKTIHQADADAGGVALRYKTRYNVDTTGA